MSEFELLSTIFHINPEPVIAEVTAILDAKPKRMCVPTRDVIDTCWGRTAKDDSGSSVHILSAKSSSDSLMFIRDDSLDQLSNELKILEASYEAENDTAGAEPTLKDKNLFSMSTSTSASTLIEAHSPATPITEEKSIDLTSIHSKASSASSSTTSTLISEIMDLQTLLLSTFTLVQRVKSEYNDQIHETSLLAKYTANLRSKTS